jgi:hypothetical protein
MSGIAVVSGYTSRSYIAGQWETATRVRMESGLGLQQIVNALLVLKGSSKTQDQNSTKLRSGVAAKFRLV